MTGEVSCLEPYEWIETPWSIAGSYGQVQLSDRHVVCVDYGAKRNILPSLGVARRAFRPTGGRPPGRTTEQGHRVPSESGGVLGPPFQRAQEVRAVAHELPRRIRPIGSVDLTARRLCNGRGGTKIAPRAPYANQRYLDCCDAHPTSEMGHSRRR
jgi:hypothetical protein